MTETAEMQEAEPILFLAENGEAIAVEYGMEAVLSRFANMPPPAVGRKLLPLYSQPDFDAMRAQRDEWEAAAMQARDGCNQRSDTIRSLRDKLATLQAQITRLREALKPFAEYMNDGGDLDDKGCPLTDDQGPGWVYLTIADFRRARAALSEPSPSNSGDTP